MTSSNASKVQQQAHACVLCAATFPTQNSTTAFCPLCQSLCVFSTGKARSLCQHASIKPTVC